MVCSVHVHFTFYFLSCVMKLEYGIWNFLWGSVKKTTTTKILFSCNNDINKTCHTAAYYKKVWLVYLHQRYDHKSKCLHILYTFQTNLWWGFQALLRYDHFKAGKLPASDTQVSSNIYGTNKKKSSASNSEITCHNVISCLHVNSSK